MLCEGLHWGSGYGSATRRLAESWLREAVRRQSVRREDRPARTGGSHSLFSRWRHAHSLEARPPRPIDETPHRDRTRGQGVGFRSITENIDTTTSGGRLVFHLFGALAQFERDLIRERTRAGLQAAEERGRRGGRQVVVTPEKLAKARQHLAAGLNVREAAARVKIGKTALYEALRAEKSTTSTVKPT